MVDRRVRRSRRALQQALVEATLDKGYEAVTVEDITERADVARATLYAHFHDKEDLLAAVAEDFVVGILTAVEAAEEGTESLDGRATRVMLEYVLEHEATFRCIVTGGSGGLGLRRLMDALAAQVSDYLDGQLRRHQLSPRMDRGMLAALWAGQQVALMRWWVDQDPRPPLQATAQARFSVDRLGLAWALGADLGGAPLYRSPGEQPDQVASGG